MVSAAPSWIEKFRAVVGEKWNDFRERSGFYQARVALIVVYVAIVLATLFIAPPRADDVIFTWGKVSFGASELSYVEIVNNDLGDLKDVKVEVRGEGIEFDGRRKKSAWFGTIRRLDEGERISVKPDRLKDKDGFRAPNQIDISFVVMTDSDGDIIAKGIPARKPK